MNDAMDFNGADAQDAAFALIPAGTLVKIRLSVRPGSAGPDGWLTQSRTSAALYLNTEAVILEGPHTRRRIYTRIGYKGRGVNERGEDTYANRGRSLLRGILESARGIRAGDQSERARAARTVRSLGDLNGLELVVKIGIDKDRDNPTSEGRNVIVAAIGPDHAEYARLMGDATAPLIPHGMGQSGSAPYGSAHVASPPAGPATPPAAPGGNAPFWAR
jgi:hypothetical protein